MTDAQRRNIIARLRDAAIERQGDTYVRGAHAARIIGVRGSYLLTLEMRGDLVGWRRHVEMSRSAPSGVEVYYRLDGLLGLIERRCRRHYRPWTAQERQIVTQMVPYSSAEDIAKRLTRSAHAVRDELRRRRHGMRARALAAHRLISSGRLGKICRRSVAGITRWAVQCGCPHVVTPGGQRLFDLRDVRQWLIGRPTVLAYLDRQTRQLLRIDIRALQSTNRSAA